MARAKKPATATDMVRSLLVILVPIVLISWFFSSNLKDYPVQAVDWRPVLTQARDQATYPVLAPTNLPESWVPTRVSWTPKGTGATTSLGNDWMLGYLSPDTVYFGLRQSDGNPAKVIADASREAEQDGSSTVGSQTWDRYVSEDGRTRSLVVQGQGVTTVVTADAPYPALEAYAATLTSR